MSEYVGELKLKEPLTKEDYEMIADVDFKYTNKVTFTTPHCGEVEFVKVVRCKDCKWWGLSEYNTFGIHVCKKFSGVRGKSDYCSRAERKE